MKTENKKAKLLSSIDEVRVMMATTLGFIVPTVESAKVIIEQAWTDRDYEKINMIFDEWQIYNK